MKRTLLQLYLTGCDEAIALYQQAFGATVECVYRDANNVVEHAEILAYGQYISFSERTDETVCGNTMEFCFDFGEGHEAEVRKAYEVLKVGAKVLYPIGAVDWSPCMFALMDRFGVNWCLFV